MERNSCEGRNKSTSELYEYPLTPLEPKDKRGLQNKQGKNEKLLKLAGNLIPHRTTELAKKLQTK